jgi:glycosyltransferase involved in cell wall biosynthesis
MRPAVSICVPAYEQPEFLRRCLISIFSQDFQDFEVIVTDDSASDDIQKVVEKWSKDERMRYHKNKVRLGSPANWNAAMALARSYLIKFVHHDDWFATVSSLKKYVEVMNASPDVTFAFSAANACEDDGSLIFLHQPTQSQVEHFANDPFSLQFANFIGAPSATIFRKLPDFEFDPQLKWVVDIDAYLRIMGPSPRFSYIPEPLISISSNGVHQVTRDFAADHVTRAEEHLYLYAKHTPKELKTRLNGLQFIHTLLHGLNHSELKILESRKTRRRQTVEEQIVMKFMKIQKNASLILKKLFDKIRGEKVHQRFAKSSYSQCGEDMICDFLFGWMGISQISYIDIGAHHAKWLSNTYHFYECGGRGVLIEPDDELCEGLMRERPGDIVVNAAVAEAGEGIVSMYVMTSRTLNTLDRTTAYELVANGYEKI